VSLVHDRLHQPLVTVQEMVKIGQSPQACFKVANRSRVVVNVQVPNLLTGQAERHPDWLEVDPRTGCAAMVTLGPGQEREFSFGIRTEIVHAQLHGSLNNIDVSFRMPLFVDVDYGRQDRKVLFSLMAQADLTPAAIEYKCVWLDNPSRLTLPLKIRTSGEDMHISDVRLLPRDPDQRDIVDALFEQQDLAALRNKALPGGQLVPIAITSGPIAERLQTVQRPRVVDPYTAKRDTWFEQKWPEWLLVEFDVEVQLATTGDPVDPVRTHVVLELVRPALLRDSTPEDPLWCAVEPGKELPIDLPRAFEPPYTIDDSGKMDFAAELSNDSAFPVRVEEVTTDAKWLRILSRSNQLLQPGETYTVHVSADMSRRSREELSAPQLIARINVRTTPPLPRSVAQLKALAIQCAAVEILPGCLGIDFGTSNCAVCYMPGRPPGSALPGEKDPLAVPLEDASPGAANPLLGEPNLPSVVARRLHAEPSAADPEFAFGKDAEFLEPIEPANVIRGLKRLLGQQADTPIPLRGTEANAKPEYMPQEITERLLRHIVRQAQERGKDVPQFAKRVAEAQLLPGHSAPALERLKAASSVRYTSAVFTHPVDASEKIKRILYESALAVDLANDARGNPLSYEEFARERLIDEACAAIGTFTHQHRAWLEDLADAKPPSEPHITLVCLDVGGGTTDISVMRYHPFEGRLELLYRKGINDFAGMDIDRAIVMDILRRATPALTQAKLQVSLLARQVQLSLEGVPRRNIEQELRRLAAPDVSPTQIEDAYVLGVSRVASVLRGRAESIKKRLADSPDGETTISLESSWQVLDDNAGTFAPLGDLLAGSVQISVPHREVVQLVTQLVNDRMNDIDYAVRSAQLSWRDVEVLLFTGQTCRSPALREAVLGHVRTARGGTLPKVVAPARDGAPLDTEVLVFDPKTCVAAGAALKGVGLNNISRVDGVTLGVEVADSNFDNRLEATFGLPACMMIRARGRDGRAVMEWRVDGVSQPALELPEGHFPGEIYLLVVDKSRHVWIAKTGPEGMASGQDVPSALSAFVAAVPSERRTTYKMKGPVVTWAAKLHELSRGGA
jgi:molecular chaperone DnaK (HSP70)